MYEESERIEDIDRIKMYKMIKVLNDYDYFSTKCFVNELLKRRSNEQEIKNLEYIKELLFYQKQEEVKKKLDELIDKEAKNK